MNENERGEFETYSCIFCNATFDLSQDGYHVIEDDDGLSFLSCAICGGSLFRVIIGKENDDGNEFYKQVKKDRIRFKPVVDEWEVLEMDDYDDDVSKDVLGDYDERVDE